MELMDPVGHPRVLVVVESVLVRNEFVVVRVAYVCVIPDRHLNACDDLAPVELVRHDSVKTVFLEERLHFVDRNVRIRIDDDRAELSRRRLAVVRAVLEINPPVKVRRAGRGMRVRAVNYVVVAFAV